MKNIFKEAKFGDRFKTRGNRMAVYIKYVDDILKPHLLLVDGDGEIACNNEGLIWARHPDIEVSNDIIGKWEDSKINGMSAQWIKCDDKMPEETKYESDTLQGHREWTESKMVLCYSSDHCYFTDWTRNGEWMSLKRNPRTVDGWPITVIAWCPITEYTEE